MQAPLQITFRNMDRSPSVEDKVREYVARLERHSTSVVSCDVVVELLHKHHARGNHYHVRVELRVPGSVLVARREPDEHHGYADVYVALRDAFDSMHRQLEEHTGRMRREVKAHRPPLHGRVVEIHPADDYGRIEASDGRLVYFHRNSVVNADFIDLVPGAEVRFDEEQGDHGPQASTVHVIGKHHIVS